MRRFVTPRAPASILKAERGGFSSCPRRKLLETLEERVKCLPDSDLERLRALLIVHGFLSS